MQKVHFIGIGGIGVSALAQIYKSQGHQISGSDQKASDLTDNLAAQGAKISIGHNAANITDQNLIIYSPAIPSENPELAAAHAKGLECLTYPEALGRLSENYFTIAVAGTHGKSTTTAMLALILIEAGLDPTIVIGTKVPQINNQNYRIGNSTRADFLQIDGMQRSDAVDTAGRNLKKILLIEACEYKESFSHLKPQILIITNIEAEHLDYYKNEQNYINAFKTLADSLPETAHIIIDANDQNSQAATKTTKAHITRWQNIENLHLQIPGQHNLKNATAATQAANLLKIPQTTTKKALENFQGTWRRMEYKGLRGHTHFYDDYAHHPTEIRATLKALREKYTLKKQELLGSDAIQESDAVDKVERASKEFPKILTIFQPHQYSRTYELLDQFAASFEDTDEVIIPNIYRVRDTDADVSKVSVFDLVQKINTSENHRINEIQGNKERTPEPYNSIRRQESSAVDAVDRDSMIFSKARDGGGLAATTQWLAQNYQNYDLIITMGAGDVGELKINQ